MSHDRLDWVRFAKCRAMMERGATPGERLAGEAAARRVAAAAGLSLGEALRLSAAATQPRAEAPAATPRRPYPWEKPPLRTDPIGVDEILAQKAINLARLKRKAAREARRLREDLARQEAERAELRAAQAQRDRAWAAGESPADDLPRT